MTRECAKLGSRRGAMRTIRQAAREYRLKAGRINTLLSRTHPFNGYRSYRDWYVWLYEVMQINYRPTEIAT